MNKTTMFLSGLALGGAALLSFSTFAYRGDPGVENPDPVNQERHEQVESMFENGNYESFQKLFEGRGPARVIDNEDDFNKFVDLRQARENSNTEKAEALAEELGLGQRPQDGSGMNRGQRGHGMGRGYGMGGGQGMLRGHGMGGGQHMGMGRGGWNHGNHNYMHRSF